MLFQQAIPICQQEPARGMPLRHRDETRGHRQRGRRQQWGRSEPAASARRNRAITSARLSILTRFRLLPLPGKTPRAARRILLG